jgi:hypothetical protein
MGRSGAFTHSLRTFAAQMFRRETWRAVDDFGMEATKRDLLQRATRLYGASKLAAKLGVSEKTLDAWMRGETTMPDGKLYVLACILQELANKRV